MTNNPQLRLRYALLKDTENELRFVDDVSNGLACNCVCPNCGKEVIAKNRGSKKEHHFAHAKGADCAGARMTALHMLAQCVLEEMKQVMLPAYNGEILKKTPRPMTFSFIKREEICKEEDSTRRPDCIGYNEGKTQNLWIEIYCCHKIDDAKKEDIISRKQYCIEIDFSDLLKTNYTKEDVEHRLIEDSSHSQWICCPKWDEDDKKLCEQKEKEIRENKRKEEEHKKKLAEQEGERKQKRIEYLIQLADQWHSDLDQESANRIVNEIRYTQKNQEKIYDYLIPNSAWGTEYKRFPRNHNGLQVFYCLIRSYYKYILLGHLSSDVEESMWSLINNTRRSQEEDILLEYIVTIWAVDKLNMYYNGDWGNKVYISVRTDAKFRAEFIKILLREGKDRLMDVGAIQRISHEYESKPFGDSIIQLLRICIPQKEEIHIPEKIEIVTNKSQEAYNDYQPSQEQLEILSRVERYSKHQISDQEFLVRQ